MTGVVGHPVSEKGRVPRRGGARWKPFTVSSGIPVGPNSPAPRKSDCAGESSSQRRVSPLSRKRGKAKLISPYNPGGTTENQPFVPEWMKGFLFNQPKEARHVREFRNQIRGSTLPSCAGCNSGAHAPLHGVDETHYHEGHLGAQRFSTPS